jgi:hypothetical protein
MPRGNKRARRPEGIEAVVLVTPCDHRNDRDGPIRPGDTVLAGKAVPLVERGKWIRVTFLIDTTAPRTDIDPALLNLVTIALEREHDRDHAQLVDRIVLLRNERRRRKTRQRSAGEISIALKVSVDRVKKVLSRLPRKTPA